MITVNHCGYNSMHAFPHDRFLPEGYSDYVLLLIKTEGYIEIDGQITALEPNSILLYAPHSYIHYGCEHAHYNDDWIHFELHGDDTDLLTKLAIPVNTPVHLSLFSTLTDYSRLIVTETHNDRIHTYETLNALMHALLYSIADLIQMNNDDTVYQKYYHPIHELRMKIQNAPHEKWNIPALASSIHLSASYFQHLYKDFFGTTCIQDIIEARIKQAQFYLSTSNIAIAKLALICGYENELHFMRQFKKITGMTPSQYRAARKQ